MNVKAEAYQEYNQAAVIDKLLTGLPEVVRALAAPLANVDKITVVSTGNGDAAGMNKITGDIDQDGGAGSGVVRDAVRHEYERDARQSAADRRQGAEAGRIAAGETAGRARAVDGQVPHLSRPEDDAMRSTDES